jgi:Arc/MetJ-type ribon-helix-helix transcriptional regulator
MIIGGIVVNLVVAVATGLLAVTVVAAPIIAQQEIEDARTDAIAQFESLVDEVSSLERELEQTIQEAQTVIETTVVTELLEPAVVDELNAALPLAVLEPFEPPVMETQTVDIERQIVELRDLGDRFESTLSALRAAVDEVESSRQALAARVAAEREAALRAAISPNATYSMTQTDGSGNQQRVTVSIGSWIRGSETAALADAWRIVGGSGPAPLADLGSDGAYVFGTVALENLTPDFPSENFANGQSWVYLSPLLEFDGLFRNFRDPSFEGFGATLQAREYSSGVLEDAVSGSNPLIRADMRSTTWGPVPFVIGLDTVFSPKFPDGNPKIDEIVFRISGSIFARAEGDQSFQVGRSW